MSNLDHESADPHPPRPQKVAAVFTGVCGGATVVGVRVFAELRPGANAVALAALAVGWMMLMVGCGWYLWVRRIEG